MEMVKRLRLIDRVRLAAAAGLVDLRGAATNAAMARAGRGQLRRAMVFAWMAWALDRLRGYPGALPMSEWYAILRPFARERAR